MINAQKAQSLAIAQNDSLSQAIAVEDSIKESAQLGNFSASHAFPVDFISSNIKTSLTLNNFAVSVTTAQVLGVAASYTGQVAGMTSDVTITADNKGTAGNSVTLNFDGVLTISDAISNFNTANPSNTISLLSGIGSQIPNNLTSISLSGGVNAVAEIISIGFAS